MIVFDVETTGLSPQKDSIIAIGAVNFESPQHRFYAICRPFEGSAKPSPEALKINGADWLDNPKVPSLKDALSLFLGWADQEFEIPTKTANGPVRTPIFGGENVGSFDIKFLDATITRYGIQWRHDYHSVDLFSGLFLDSIARGAFPQSMVENGILKVSTDKILNFVGLEAEPKPHKALTGALLEAEAFSRLARGVNLLPEYANHPIPKYLINRNGLLRNTPSEEAVEQPRKSSLFG